MSNVERERKDVPASISPTGWTANRDLDLAEWVEAGRLLGGMGRCSAWGLGDWIRYGDSKFGERYTRAAKISGYDKQTLMNMVYVASRFEFSRRRENLSWSHHETVAGLARDEQDNWLDHAAEQELSQRDLRDALRAARAQVATVADKDAADPNVITCPHCGGAVPVTPIMRLVA